MINDRYVYDESCQVKVRKPNCEERRLKFAPQVQKSRLRGNVRFERVEIGALLILSTEGLGAFPELTGRRQGERMGTVGTCRNV